MRRWYPVTEMRDVLRVVAESAGSAALAEPSVDVDCAKLARQLRHSARATVGLLPSGKAAEIQPLALELAFAISLVTEKLTVILDPEQGSGAPSDEAGALFMAYVPAPSVVTIVPVEKAPVGSKFEMVRLLHQLVMRDPETFGQVLVDLSGCRLPGELLGATNMLQGIIVVGSGGKTSENDLRETMKTVPEDLALGVLLTE